MFARTLKHMAASVTKACVRKDIGGKDKLGVAPHVDVCRLIELKIRCLRIDGEEDCSGPFSSACDRSLAFSDLEKAILIYLRSLGHS